jgi:hypothetical protein
MLATNLIVVGQRPELHAIRSGALGKFFRGQGPVGNDGVAMQVGIQDGHHAILGLTACG